MITYLDMKPKNEAFFIDEALVLPIIPMSIDILNGIPSKLYDMDPATKLEEGYSQFIFLQL